MGGAVAVALALAALVTTRLGTEFLPELDEGDLLVYAEMPASISLTKGSEVLLQMRQRLSSFPEVVAVLSEQGRPEDGTDNESINLGKLLVRLLPREAWRPGWTKERLIAAMRESLTAIPGVRYNFSQPIRDAVDEAVSGARGKVVFKVVGRDLEAMRTKLLEAMAVIRGAGVVDLDLYRDATVPQVRVSLNRPALARAGINAADALDVVETALGGSSRRRSGKTNGPWTCGCGFLPRSAPTSIGSGRCSWQAPKGGRSPCAMSRPSTSLGPRLHLA